MPMVEVLWRGSTSIAYLAQATFDDQKFGVVARGARRVRGPGYATQSRLLYQAPGSDPIRQCVAVL
jgi:hypothetical protein